MIILLTAGAINNLLILIKKGENMQTEIIRADTRGHFDFGWLNTYHTFSFGDYHNPERKNFGALRVVNDDLIHANSMFPTHPHNNMEIITIVLSGTLEHTDSLENKAQIQAGEIQVMSAGTGITHAEANPSATEPVSLFQIWIYPKVRDIVPHYTQASFTTKLQQLNQWQQLVSPQSAAQVHQLTINQDAFLSLGKFSAANHQYQLNLATNGVFLMVIDGSIAINADILQARDAILISDIAVINFQVSDAASLLLIEVPLSF